MVTEFVFVPPATDVGALASLVDLLRCNWDVEFVGVPQNLIITGTAYVSVTAVTEIVGLANKATWTLI